MPTYAWGQLPTTFFYNLSKWLLIQSFSYTSSNPDPTFHFGSNSDLTVFVALIRIQNLLFILILIQIQTWLSLHGNIFLYKLKFSKKLICLTFNITGIDIKETVLTVKFLHLLSLYLLILLLCVLVVGVAVAGDLLVAPPSPVLHPHAVPAH